MVSELFYQFYFLEKLAGFEFVRGLKDVVELQVGRVGACEEKGRFVLGLLNKGLVLWGKGEEG